MKTVKFVTAIAFAALALPALAQAPSTKEGDAAQRRIDQRQAAQQKRIQAGQKSGQLTDKEAARLNKQQARIQKMEDKARADGKVTRQEARKIERAQDRASKDIRRERHDKQRVK